MSQRKVLTGSNANLMLNGQSIYMPATSGTYTIVRTCSCPVNITFNGNFSAADEARVADLFRLLHKLMHKDVRGVPVINVHMVGGGGAGGHKPDMAR